MLYKEQGSVERGFRFLKDPLFLASSVARQKAGAYRCARLDHGALPAGLPLSRIPATDPPG